MLFLPVREVPALKEEVSQAAIREADRQADEGLQARLVARCLEGDQLAFNAIVDLYGDLLLRTAYLLVQDEEAAKDILQEALLLAWRNIRQLREPAALRAWLVRIVVNQATTLKRQWARRSVMMRQQLLQSQVEQRIEVSNVQRGQLEETLDLRRAIQQLPVNQRVALVLFYYQRMTVPEIAVLLDVSENTLRKRLQAALDKIRKVLRAPVPSLNERTAFLNNLPTQVGYSGEHGNE